MADGSRPLVLWRAWKQVLGLLWRTHPWAAAGTMLCGVLGGFSRIAVLDTINRAIHSDAQRAHLLLPFAGLMALALASRAGSELLPAYTSREIATRLRRTLCRRVLVTRLAELERRGVPRMLALLTHDVPSMAHALVLLPQILVEGMIVAIGFAYLANLSWSVLALTVITLVAGLALHLQLFRRGLNSAQKARDEIDAFNESTHALLFGIKELQLHGRRRRWFRRAMFDLSSKRLARADYVAQAWFSGGGAVQQISMMLLISALVFAAPALHLWTPAMLTASVLAVMFLMGPFAIVVSSVPPLGEATMALQRLEEFGVVGARADLLHATAPLPYETARSNKWHSIELQETAVTFGQPGASGYFRMGPVNAQFRPGERVFIVGDNGSGKSTLAKVLAGLYLPGEGRVLLDGRVLDEKDLGAYRELFSAIFADFHLFKRIISPGASAANRTLANHYLHLLGLDRKVHIDGDSYSTTTSLSNGQRKRLALVCAYLEDRPVYVFDEWAADQDPSFKRFFYEVLLAEMKERGKCVIVITHDSQYFRLADRLIHMKDGRVESDSQLTAA